MRERSSAAFLGVILTFGGFACIAPPGQEKAAKKNAATTTEAGSPRAATAPSNGWGEDIAWRGYEEGLAEAKKDSRPIMMVVHTSWCSRCKALKPRFQETALSEMSEHFVMINVDQDEEPRVEEHGPDGNYIPRVMFLDPEGTVAADLKNPKRNRTRYFYTQHDNLVSVMRKALDRHGNRS